MNFFCGGKRWAPRWRQVALRLRGEHQSEYLKIPQRMKTYSAASLFLSASVGLLCAIPSEQARAGQFSVTPVRIYMEPKDRAIAVTVTNEGDAQLVMQADLFEWKQQPGGEDELTATEEVFLSPPILKMAPKSRQVVRLARVSRPQQSDHEITYRMIVREIPEARPPSADSQVQIALAFSLPVFITPKNAKPILDCNVARLAVDKLQVTCTNSGNAHTHPVSFLLSTTAGSKLAEQGTGGYILPNIRRSFELKREDGNIPAGKARLAVALANGTTQNFDVTVD
jgi:fimbrial chaperone protein